MVALSDQDFLWRQWASERGEAIAIRHDAGTRTWKQLADQLDTLAFVLRQQGVGVGNGVALRGKNSLMLLQLYLACLQVGARVLPLNPQLPMPLIQELLPQLGINFGWSAEPCAWSLTALNTEAAPKAEIVHIGCDPDQPVTLTLTSASSGFPKAAVHTPNAHAANAKGVVAMMGFERDDCWLLSLPLYHVSGQGIVWRWLTTGAQLAVREGIPLDQALDGCTHASLVPTQLLRLLDNPPKDLKKVLLGGAMIPVELVQRAEQAGIACWCGYGLTEMASTVCAKRADALPGVGLPLPGRKVKLVDEELWLCGAGQALGYWKDGTVVPLVDADGWFHTRDRGAFENNEWRVLGRLDNMFISGGENIQPETIERVLQQYPGVQQAIVVPVDDPKFGQRPVAVIEGEVDLGQLEPFAADQLARFQQPIAYLPLPETLKTGAIKISREAVREWVVSSMSIPARENGRSA